MKKEVRNLLVLFSLSFVVSTILMVSPIRSYFRESLSSGDSKIYSVLESEFDENRLKFVKVLRNKNLYIEVYKNELGRPVLIDSESLGEVKNAGMKISNISSELFLKNIDNIGWPELIVPIADRELKGKITVFRISEKDFQLTRL